MIFIKEKILPEPKRVCSKQGTCKRYDNMNYGTMCIFWQRQEQKCGNRHINPVVHDD